VGEKDEMSMINETPTGMIIRQLTDMRITCVSSNMQNERNNLNT